MTLLKHAFRQLGLRPGLSAAIIAMLAIGIGSTTAIFSLFHRVLVEPLPVPEPGRLVNIVRAGSTMGFSYPMFRDLEAEQGGLSGIAAHWPFEANMVHGEGAVGLLATYVSAEYFAVLNLQPSLGRLIGPQDEPAPGESAVVVLSHDLWHNRFGGDPSILGRALTINGQSLTVIGVAPKGFSGTQLGVRSQLFVPLTMRWRLEPMSAPASLDNRNFTWLRLFGRLGTGVSVEHAAAEIDAVHRRMVREIEAPLRGVSEDALPQSLRGSLEVVPGGRGQGSIPGAAQSLSLLLAVTVLVLLIVCVNVANLLLVRGAARAGEMAVRESLGASRRHLIAQLFAEAALPGAIGGALALPVAAITLAAVTPVLPGRFADGFALAIGWRAAAFAALVMVAAVIAFGLLPALRTARAGAASALKGHAAQAVGGRGATRLRSALVAAQIAFSMVLLVLAGLFAQSLLNVARIDLGIDVDSVVSFSVSPRLNGYDDERTAAIYEGIEQALAAQPGAIAVAAAAVPVLAGRNFELDLTVEGSDGGGEPVRSRFNIIGPGFFETLGIPLLAGRGFGATDVGDSPPVAIVNERLARRLGPTRDALGQWLRAGPDRYEIVGVVANAAYDQVKGEPPAQFFVPLEGNHSLALPWSLTFYVRTGLDPDALAGSIPRVIASVDATLPVSDLVPLRRQAQENVFVDRLVTVLSAGFAGLATLLAAIGLYGVMAYGVAQRTRELGLRLALGAEPATLRAMMLKQAGRMAFIGIAIGLVAAVGLARAAEALLYGLSSRDPAVLGAAAAVLAAVVLAASYWPARRASGIAPMEALRHE
jgi:putative ABC transport system permease protein